MQPQAARSAGLKGIRRIDDFELNNQRVYIRCDFNVPMQDGKITDDRRIRSALPTIQYALSKGAKVVCSSHFGRPEKGGDRSEFSLEPIGVRLGELLGCEVILVEDPGADIAKTLLAGLKPKQVLLLENLRFDPGETKNSREFAQKMAQYTDIYINDAFGASHRAHASIDALPRLIERRGIGFLIDREITSLDRLLNRPAQPYYTILGGAKVSDKIPVIENMLDRVDGFLIGGAMAYTFLHAKGSRVGNSRIEKDKVSFAREMMDRLAARKKKILLPIDHIVAEKFEDPKQVSETPGENIPDGMMGLDIGPKTVELFRSELSRAKTIFWNGPMGVFENIKFSRGTFAIAETLAELKDVCTIVGGGDSAAAAEASGYAEKMTHISTGGGASLEYLQGEKLPGLEVLRS